VTTYKHFLDNFGRLTKGFTVCRLAVFDFKFSRNSSGVDSEFNNILVLAFCPKNALDRYKQSYRDAAGAVKQEFDKINKDKCIPFEVC
jgi:hypothetical protein